MKPILISTMAFVAIFFGHNLSAAVTTLHCPPDQTLPCTAQTYNLMAYGDAFVMRDGKKYDAGLANVTKDLNVCNVGVITRKWEVQDENGATLICTQTLTFEAGDFGLDNITWPMTKLDLEGCDADTDPSSLPPGYQRPTYYHGLCNNIGESFKDTEVIFGPDCVKLIREWTLVDWCSFNPISGEGSWTFHQIIKISNDSDPVITCPGKRVVVAKECTGAYVNLPLATAEGENCTGGEFVITNNSVFADTTTNDASGIYPVGDHLITFFVDFACSAQNKCETLISVIEPNPVPYCLATINVVLMGIDTDGDGAVDDGMVELWAKDIDVNSFHPCDNRPLNFSFEADSVVMVRSFSCQDIGRNNINMYVSDQEGRQSFCRVTVEVQNNAANIPNCRPQAGSRPLISGLVTNPMGEPIEEVYVTHRDMSPTTEHNSNGANSYQNVHRESTSANGSYSSDDIAMERSYQIQAYKVGDISRVTVSDVALLESYVKGEIHFKSPYTFLAADLNEDGTVDINDFHLINNLVGADESLWPNQKQWIFFTARSLENQDNSGQPIMPRQLAKTMEIELLNYGYGDHGDFIGILKGDLDYYEGLIE